MKIELPDEIFGTTFNEAAENALRDALESYEVKRKLSEHIVSNVSAEALSQAVTRALEQWDTKAFSEKLSAALSRMIEIATVEIIVHSFANVLVSIRTEGKYITSEETSQLRKKVSQELMQGLKGERILEQISEEEADTLLEAIEQHENSPL